MPTAIAVRGPYAPHNADAIDVASVDFPAAGGPAMPTTIRRPAASSSGSIAARAPATTTGCELAMPLPWHGRGPTAKIRRDALADLARPGGEPRGADEPGLQKRQNMANRYGTHTLGDATTGLPTRRIDRIESFAGTRRRCR